MKKKLLCVLLAFVFILSVLTGCSHNAASSVVSESDSTPIAEETTSVENVAEETSNVSTEKTTVSAAEPEEDQEQTNMISYPLEQTSQTITLWTTIPGNQTSILPNGYNDHFLIDDVEEVLGINIDITSVAQIGMGDTTDFDLMIASGDWPDLLNVTSYKGGLSQAFNDDVIIQLTDDMLSANAPDYYAVLMSQSEENIRATQTEGAYYALYSITQGEGSSASRGMVIRTDWLDELNMEIPATIDDLTSILKAFKSEYNPTYTYFIEADADLVYMCAPFNTYTVGYYNNGSLPVYRDGNEVKVAWATDEYRAFLEWFHDCYSAGIFEASFYSTASDQSSDRYSYLIDGQIGVYEDSPTSIADWREYALEGESVEVSFFPNLVDENGSNTWGEEQQIIDTLSAMSITTACDNPELALNVLNYFFTEDGAILANYGKEGYSFNYNSDGEVEYTELVTNSEYQLSVRALHGLYTWNLFPYMTYSDAMYPMYTEEVLEAIDIMSTDGITAEHYYPSAISLTSAESDSIITTVTDVATYSQEQLLKFMVGDLAITDENWNAYVEQVYAYGLQDAIDVYQHAYDEYVAGER